MYKEITELIKEVRKQKFSYVVIYILILALLYKYSYYNAFTVDILSFITISDLYTILIDLLPTLVYFFGFLVLLLIVFFLTTVLFSRIRKPKEVKPNNKFQNIKSRLFSFTITNFIMFGFFYVNITIYAFPFLIPKVDMPLYTFDGIFLKFMTLIMFMTMLSININYVELLKRFFYRIKLNPNKLKLILVGLTIFYMTGITATLDAGVKIKYDLNSVVEFEYLNKKISTNDSNIVYAGIISDYIFLFYKDIGLTKSYKKSEITNLNFYNDMYHTHQNDIIFKREIEELEKEDELMKMFIDVALDSTISVNKDYKSEMMLNMAEIQFDSLTPFEIRKKEMNNIRQEYFSIQKN